MPIEEQGVSRVRYKIIPRTLIFIRYGDSILLIKGATHKRLWANKYNGVGGHVERGEDIFTAAQRELLEETGLSVKISFCGIVTVDTGEDIGIGVFVFRGEYNKEELKPSKEGNLEWVKINDLHTHPLVEDVQLLINRIIRMDANDLPFFAHSSYDSENKLVLNFRN